MVQRLFIVIGGFFLFALYGLHSSLAVEPQIFVTWKAKAYAPADYTGKILPTASTLIDASLELIDNGQLAHLEDTTIYWYVNDTFVSGGRNVQNISFRTPAFTDTSVEVRAQLPDYKGEFLAKTIRIPVVRPEAVIRTPIPGRTFSASRLTLEAIPYFFNAPSPRYLNFAWTVNGTPPDSSDDPDILNLIVPSDLPGNAPVEITLKIRDPNIKLTVAQSSLQLVYVK